jgi:hypothetical protein
LGWSCRFRGVFGVSVFDTSGCDEKEVLVEGRGRELSVREGDVVAGWGSVSWHWEFATKFSLHLDLEGNILPCYQRCKNTDVMLSAAWGMPSIYDAWESLQRLLGRASVGWS